MADELTEDEYDYEAWMASVEFRLGRLRLGVMVDGAIAIGAIALGAVAFKAISNIGTSLVNINQATSALMQVVFPGQVPVQVKETPDAGIDETLIPPPTDVAEPYEAPASEPDEETRAMIKSDPISPAELAKLDQLRAEGDIQ